MTEVETDVKAFLAYLIELNTLLTLNYSWNGLSVLAARGIGKLLQHETLQTLDISNNRLDNNAMKFVRLGLKKNENLKILKCGKNLFDADEAERLVQGLMSITARLQVLDMEEQWVNKSFKQVLQKLKERQEIEVVYAGVYSDYVVTTVDLKDLLLKRAQYEGIKPKKKSQKKDFGHLLLSLKEEVMDNDDFYKASKRFKIKVVRPVLEQLAKEFKAKKGKVDIVAMREHYMCLFPETTEPPPKIKKERKAKKEKKIDRSKAKEKELVQREEYELEDIEGEYSYQYSEIVDLAWSGQMVEDELMVNESDDGQSVGIEREESESNWERDSDETWDEETVVEEEQEELVEI